MLLCIFYLSVVQLEFEFKFKLNMFESSFKKMENLSSFPFLLFSPIPSFLFLFLFFFPAAQNHPAGPFLFFLSRPSPSIRASLSPSATRGPPVRGVPYLVSEPDSRWSPTRPRPVPLPRVRTPRHSTAPI